MRLWNSEVEIDSFLEEKRGHVSMLEWKATATGIAWIAIVNAQTPFVR